MEQISNDRLHVAVAMSGGVDSAVAAHLLRAAGHDVMGVTLRMFGKELLTEEAAGALHTEDPVSDAKDAADRLSIPHTALDFDRDFRRCVVDPFVNTYKEGGTPNPCVECNRTLKFGKLLTEAESLGYPYLATGHYARIERSPEGRHLIRLSEDATKDQTYMLWALTQTQLSRVLFPLGGLKKSEVREIAASIGFTSASKKDSQDICFIPDGDYAAFIRRYTGEDFPEGDFVDRDGKPLGKHRGIINYTVGQRKGLGIALGEPMYVRDKDVARNTVTLVRNEELFGRALDVTSANLILWDKLDAPVRVKARVRYHHTPEWATVTQLAEDRLHVEFDNPVRAIAKGQSFVMYVDDYLAGGGIIS